MKKSRLIISAIIFLALLGAVIFDNTSSVTFKPLPAGYYGPPVPSR